MKKQFQESKANEYIEKRFPNMNAHEVSNNYWGMDRVSEDEETIIIRICGENLIETRYGFALPIAADTVIFLKDFQVKSNYFETNMILKKQYFKVSKWGDHPDFGEMDPEKESWDGWLQIAKEQQALDEESGRVCKIEKTAKEKMVQSFQKQSAKKAARK